jgi:hypothetical protein
MDWCLHKLVVPLREHTRVVEETSTTGCSIAMVHLLFCSRALLTFLSLVVAVVGSNMMRVVVALVVTMR